MPKTYPPIQGQNKWRGLRIGLLGGSFNPAHEGHLHISNEAMKHFDLDWIWWLVSPQNPLKDKSDTAPFATRMKIATEVAASNKRILVSDIEVRLGTARTYDTLKALIEICPSSQFIWLMGADNLEHFHQWFSWDKIISLVPIGILDRPEYATKALHGKFAKRYAHLRQRQIRAKTLGKKSLSFMVKQKKSNLKLKSPMLKHVQKQGQMQTTLNGWCFISCPLSAKSSTQIRNKQTQAQAHSARM